MDGEWLYPKNVALVPSYHSCKYSLVPSCHPSYYLPALVAHHHHQHHQLDATWLSKTIDAPICQRANKFPSSASRTSSTSQQAAGAWWCLGAWYTLPLVVICQHAQFAVAGIPKMDSKENVFEISFQLVYPQKLSINLFLKNMSVSKPPVYESPLAMRAPDKKKM